MTAQSIVDVLIVGGGPAGAAAAVRARQLELSVLVLDRAAEDAAGSYALWLSPAGVGICDACGVELEAAGAVVFHGLRLHSWDLKRSAEVREEEIQGRIIPGAAMRPALAAAMRRAGVHVHFGAEPVAVAVGEEFATVTLADHQTLRGRMLLVADGSDSATARLIRLRPPAAEAAGPNCVCLHLSGSSATGGVDVVIGASRSGRVVTIVHLGREVYVTLLTRDASSPASDQFAEFRAAAENAGFLPVQPERKPAAYFSPAGVAIEMDSHVGKRALLIGDAGGFVSAFSNEGLYPAMKSGWVAADTAAAALAAPVFQDELASYSARWRAELADYLRMPNTDLALLTPLVFNNPQMSARVARAFLLGQQF